MPGMTTEAGPKTLYLVDGTAQLFRAYFALPPLTNPDGLPTHAVYGFTTMLRKLMNDEKPTHLAVAFDLPGETFRHDRYSEYKANRPPTPEDLNVQAPYAKEVCRAFRIPVLELGGYEADDLIATYARLAREQDFDVMVVASDKDLLQLVGDRVKVLNPVKDVVIDAEGTCESFGVAPELVADVLGLMGDSVDNIPGVPGVGQKTALAMVRQYGALDAVIARAARFVALYDARDAVLESLCVVDGEDPLSDVAAATLMRSIREVASRLGELREHETDPEFQARLEALFEVLGAVPIDDLEGQAGKKGRTVTRDLRVLKRELKGLDRGSAKRGWYAVHDNVEQARLSRELATLDRQVPVSFDPRAVTLGPPDREQARELFRTLGFPGLLAGLDDEQEPGEAPAPAPPRQFEYSAVGTPEQLEHLVDAARKRGRFALHTRTDGPDALQADLLGIPMAVEGETAAYVPWDGDGDSSVGPSAQLRELLVDPEVTKVAHDLKRHLKVLSRRGLAIAGWELDTRVAAFLLDPGRARLDLGALATEFLGRSFEQVEPDSRRAGDLPLEAPDNDPATARAVEAVEIVLPLADVLRARLDDAGLGELYRTIDGPLLPVLASMELAGIRVEAGMLESMSVEMETSMDRLRGEIHKLSGVEFNVDSPKQLREVLFERLGLKPKRKTAKSKVSSTDARTLEDLRSEHPVARKILEYRELAKLKGTYVDALPQLINPSTGRIHTTYDPTGAASGGLSAADPELQEI